MTDEDLMSDEESQMAESLEDMQEQQAYLAGMPPPKRQDTIFRFFRELLQRKDSSKIANVKDEELGKPKLSIRGLQSIAAYAEKEGLDIVKNYLMFESEITLATSLSRKGFLPQLFVTQIKREQKVKAEREQTGWFKRRTSS